MPLTWWINIVYKCPRFSIILMRGFLSLSDAICGRTLFSFIFLFKGCIADLLASWTYGFLKQKEILWPTSTSSAAALTANTHVTESLNALNDRFAPLHISNFYDCEPVGFGGQLLNLCRGGFECDLLSRSWFSSTSNRSREWSQSVRPKACASRTMDIDILLYGNQVGIIDGVEAA